MEFRKSLIVLSAALVLSGCTGSAGSETASTSESSLYTAGTYTGTGTGMGGDVIAEVTVDDASITSITLNLDNETPSIGQAAGDELIQQILDAQSIAIDGVSGATITADGVKAAVQEALNQAMGVESVANYSLEDGTFEGTAEGHGGPLTVSITVSNGEITNVSVIEQTESWSVPAKAIEEIPAAIVSEQTLDVDVVTAATITSRAILSATANAIESAGGNAADWRTKESVNPVEVTYEDMDTTVVVVGGGSGGLSAGAFIASKGIDVIVLEKLDTVGGSMRYSAGGLAAANSEVLTAQGYDTSMERIWAYVDIMNQNDQNHIDLDFVEYLLDQSGETIDQMITDFGYEPFVLMSAYNEYAHVLFGGDNFGAGFSDLLADTITSNGGTIITGVTAESLIIEDDVVTGVNVNYDGGTFKVTADNVVLATGGSSYGMDDLLIANEPGLETATVYTEASVGNTGDGYRMLEAVDANFLGDDVQKFGFLAYDESLHYFWLNSPDISNTIVVDADGNRFANESPVGDGDMFTVAMAQHGSPSNYVIFDGATIEESLKANLDAHEESKNVYVYADTIAELAEKLDMDADVLQNTYDTYQAAAAAGVDEEFGKDAEFLVEFDGSQGFYAVYVMPETWGTMGGVTTDSVFHVQTTDGSTIDNLYAVGELSTGELFGIYYMGGFSLSYYATEGRLVSEDIAAKLD